MYNNRGSTGQDNKEVKRLEMQIKTMMRQATNTLFMSTPKKKHEKMVVTEKREKLFFLCLRLLFYLLSFVDWMSISRLFLTNHSFS